MSNYVEIDADAWRFQPRVAAVCVWQDHVLLQEALDGEFWVLPGGRLQPLELTADALIRTMRWEIGQEVTVGRLLWVMEYIAPIAGRPVHELGFYYALEPSPRTVRSAMSRVSMPAWNAVTSSACVGSRSMPCRRCRSSRTSCEQRSGSFRTARNTSSRRASSRNRRIDTN